MRILSKLNMIFRAIPNFSSIGNQNFHWWWQIPNTRENSIGFTWLFSSFWLFSKGMWKNAVGMLVAVTVIDRLLNAMLGDFTPASASIGLHFGVAYIFGSYATRLYKKSVEWWTLSEISLLFTRWIEIALLTSSYLLSFSGIYSTERVVVLIYIFLSLIVVDFWKISNKIKHFLFLAIGLMFLALGFVVIVDEFSSGSGFTEEILLLVLMFCIGVLCIISSFGYKALSNRK